MRQFLLFFLFFAVSAVADAATSDSILLDGSERYVLKVEILSDYLTCKKIYGVNDKVNNHCYYLYKINVDTVYYTADTMVFNYLSLKQVHYIISPILLKKNSVIVTTKQSFNKSYLVYSRSLEYDYKVFWYRHYEEALSVIFRTRWTFWQRLKNTFGLLNTNNARIPRKFIRDPFFAWIKKRDPTSVIPTPITTKHHARAKGYGIIK